MTNIMTKIGFKIIVLLLLVFGGTTAIQADISPAQAALNTGELLTPNMRIQLAKEWSIDIKKLNEAIPTLSPSQQEWLRREYDENNVPYGNVRRAIEASNSKEYNIHAAKSIAAANADLISKLASGEIKDLRKETALWAALSANLLNYDANIAIMKLANMRILEYSITNTQGSNDPEIALHVRRAQGYAILTGIVIPFLYNKAP